ncbi:MULTISPECIES: hypothetical protein [Peribacillus]|uniref:DUF3221 domain-containing protein n=1 Tax=Peribacillus simplex TaxID=1478 RepID=A0A109MSS4_9BACI|nr:hypothetical protein [Peribacillus simplex]KWW11425.1 hypothetical protein AS888_02540 [Peribacillus simplex]
MKKMVNLYMFLLVVCMLGGCQTSDWNKEDIDKGEEGFITDLDDRRLLIKGTYYKVTNDTYIQDQHGKNLDYSELEVGMKVKPWHRGGVTKKTFPGKAKAELILVLTDEKSAAEQRAVTAALEHVSEADSQRFIILEVTHLPSEHVYTIEMMNRSNMDSSFMVTVEDVTDEILYLK